MATLLRKPVSRELNRLKATKNGRIEVADKTGFITAGARPVIATLTPADTIKYRVKGTRTTYESSLELTFYLTQAVEFHNDYTERCRVYKLKKDAGYKGLKKPKKVCMPHIASMLRKLHGSISGG